MRVFVVKAAGPDVIMHQMTSLASLHGVRDFRRFDDTFAATNALRTRGHGPGASVAMLDAVRKRQMPVIGSGAGVWSFTEISDAASAAVAAITHGEPGIYNIVDDEPAPVAEWLPYLATCLQAKRPIKVPTWLGRLVAGEVIVSQMTQVGIPKRAKGAKRPGGEQLAEYLESRPLMFSIAYRMTGSVSDAEDIVQEAFLRLTRTLRDGTVIDTPKAFLATITTRLAITHQGSARVRRESYVGEWLPEPLVIDETPGPAEHAEMADSLSMAFLVMLESLSPVERAVFLLREVFGYEYPDIAEITGKSEANCRQIFVRAKRAVTAGRPRFEASREESEEIARRFFAAAAGGDLAGLFDLLAPDVVMIGDGGGRAAALAMPARGLQRVARFVVGLLRQGRRFGVNVEAAWVNGQAGSIFRDADGLVAAVIVLDIADGKIQVIRSIVNPDKLRHLGPVSDMAQRRGQDLP
jgi:RNA polymerase sigma-70 factor (ECF subfamily)